jgi:hypothetical protein
VFNIVDILVKVWLAFTPVTPDAPQAHFVQSAALGVWVLQVWAAQGVVLQAAVLASPVAPQSAHIVQFAACLLL